MNATGIYYLIGGILFILFGLSNIIYRDKFIKLWKPGASGFGGGKMFDFNKFKFVQRPNIGEMYGESRAKIIVISIGVFCIIVGLFVAIAVLLAF